jgi:hypothetical protein
VGSVADWARWITTSYEDLVGRQLCVAADLYDLPSVVLCHDTSADPLFVYANAAGQRLWERSLDDFIGWPSRLTAPADMRAERAAALSHSGLVQGYSGVRVSASGRLFRIHDATVWTVSDDNGAVCGQAATFSRVTWIEGEPEHL